MTAPAGAAPASGRSRRSLAVTGAAWLVLLGIAGYLCYSGAAGGMRDLEVYRDGALAVRQGHGLYSMITSIGLPYTYPPVSAILALPLTLVPFGAGQAAWTVMICVPLAVVILIGFRPLLARSGPAAPAVFAALAGACLLLFPVRQEFYYGQVDLFLVAICLLDLEVRQPRWPRGLLIGLATAIKLEPGVFIVYLLITRRRRDAGIAALSFAAWTAIGWLADPHDSATYWTHEIFQTGRLGGNGSAANQSLRGIILRLFNPHPAPSAVWLVVALVVAVAGFAAARSCWRHGSDRAGIAITGLLAALLSPVAWIHHYCWLVFVLGVIVGDARSRGRVVTAVAALALFVTPLPPWAEHARGLALLPMRLLEDAFGLAALALVVIIYWIARIQAGERAGTAEPPGRTRPSSSAGTAGAGPAEQLPAGTG
jgi:alpha-1,2-mannosyltransferase